MGKIIEKKSILVQGNYIAPDGDRKYGQIKVVDGTIAAVGESLGVADVVYEDDTDIYPGFIDIHVHARQFPLPDDAGEDLRRAYAAHTGKETFETASRAAINGGVVAFADRPNNPWPPVDERSYAAKHALAADSCLVDHVIYALIQNGSRPFGHMPYKLFTHDHTRDEIKAVFREFSGSRLSPLIDAHCEEKEIIDENPDRTPEAEYESACLVLTLSASYGVPVHISHVSTARTLEAIVAARNSGVKVTCETTPTYIYFSKDSKDMFPMRDRLFMRPPLRAAKDCLRLLEGLKNCEIDMLATDHAPHTPEDKAAGAFGLPLIDNYTNFVGWLLQNGLSPRNILDACCVNPGRFMQRYLGDKFGRIEEGHVGSFTVVGKKEPPEIVNEPVVTKCGWSPFNGAMFCPDYLLYAHETIVRGKPVKRGFDDEVA